MQFVEDTVMYEAVKAVLFSHCDLNTIKADTPNTVIGEKAHAFLQARRILEDGFRELNRSRRMPEPDRRNPNFI